MKKSLIRTAAVFFVMLFCILLPVTTRADSLKDKDPCYKISPKITEATYKYLNEIYLEKYPSQGLAFWYGSGADQKVLQKLSDTITAGCTTPAQKADAISHWAKRNINYDINASGFPMDVFYSRKGNCQGYSQLITRLLRLAGVPAVDCAGWIGDMKKVMKLGTYSNGDGHAWVMVWLGDDWYLYDPLFDNYKINNREYISSWYMTCYIEGVTPYYDGIPFRYMNQGGSCIFYINGRFMCLENGIPLSEVLNSSYNYGFSLNGIPYMVNVRYFSSESITTDGYEYEEEPERKDQMLSDECYTNGWLNGSYSMANGISASNTIMTKNGRTIYLPYAGEYFYLPGTPDDYTLTEGAITLKVGSSISGIMPYCGESELEKGHIIVWKSMEPDIASVDANGTITGLKEGYANISYETVLPTDPDGTNWGGGFIQIYVSKKDRKADFTDHGEKKDDQLSASRPKKGTVVKASSGTFVITGNTTAQYKAPKKGAKAVTIPDRISKNGYSFKVTSIAPSAFKNNSVVQKVTIGSFVTTIGSKAFYNCKKLKSLTIKTSKLTAKKVGAKAFTGTYTKMTVAVPQKSKKAYTSLLKNKGLSKKAQIKVLK